MKKAKQFKLFVNEFHQGHTRTWAVKVHGRGWQTASVVLVYVPMMTVFNRRRFAKHLQPFAWFVGRGVVRRNGDCLVIENE